MRLWLVERLLNKDYVDMGRGSILGKTGMGSWELFRKADIVAEWEEAQRRASEAEKARAEKAEQAAKKAAEQAAALKLAEREKQERLAEEYQARVKLEAEKRFAQLGWVQQLREDIAVWSDEADTWRRRDKFIDYGMLNVFHSVGWAGLLLASLLLFHHCFGAMGIAAGGGN